MGTKVTLTLTQLAEGYEALGLLSREAVLPVNQAYWLSKQFRVIREAFEVFQEQKFDLIKKHGGTEDEQGVWEVPAEKKREYNAEYRDWMKTKVEIEIDLKPISFLQDAPKLELGGLAIQLALMDFLFTNEEPRATPRPRRRG